MDAENAAMLSITMGCNSDAVLPSNIPQSGLSFAALAISGVDISYSDTSSSNNGRTAPSGANDDEYADEYEYEDEYEDDPTCPSSGCSSGSSSAGWLGGVHLTPPRYVLHIIICRTRIECGDSMEREKKREGGTHTK